MLQRRLSRRAVPGCLPLSVFAFVLTLSAWVRLGHQPSPARGGKLSLSAEKLAAKQMICAWRKDGRFREQ